MALINSDISLILSRPPSCIEFVPNHPQYAVIGTYMLEQDDEATNLDEKKAQNRSGSIELVRVTDLAL